MTAGETSLLCGLLVVAATIMSGCQGGQCQPGNRPLLVLVDVFGSARYITSPGYPEKYPNNADCAWQFNADHSDYVIHLSVISLKLDSDYVNCRSDYVDLYEIYYTITQVSSTTPRLARLCSDKYEKEFYSTKQYLYVHFVSDAVDTGQGFNLSFRAVPKSQAPTPRATVPPYDRSTTYPSRPVSESSDDLVAKVVGGTIGGAIAFILIIIAIVFLCRRSLKPSLDIDDDPVPMTVPSAPPPEMPLHHDGGEPQETTIYTSSMRESETLLSSDRLLPGTPRTDGGRADAARSAGHSGSPRPGVRLEIPEQNGRSGSPGRGGPGGNHRHGNHLDISERGGRSVSPVQGSRGGSPRRGSPERSPRRGDRGGSPRRGSPERSPRRGDRGGSPRRGSPERSPRRGDRGGSPWRGSPERSPRPDDRRRSPRPGSPERSPRQGHRGRSPRRGSPERSPRRDDRRGSPRRADRGQNPRRGRPEGSHAWRGSDPPPPIRSLDSSGITDAPPSYDEAIGACPQPSAPPLPDENFV